MNDDDHPFSIERVLISLINQEDEEENERETCDDWLNEEKCRCNHDGIVIHDDAFVDTSILKD